MPLTPERFEAGLELFQQLVQHGDPALAASFDASRARFFVNAAGLALGDAQDQLASDPDLLASQRRHFEWFLFEYERPDAPMLVVDELLEAWAVHAPLELRAGSDAYLQSQTGIFEVVSAGGLSSGVSEPVLVRELAGLGNYELAETESERVFIVGDLIVGRIYPMGDGQFHVSPGAGVYREPRLLNAIESDLQRLREARSKGIMRLSQIELEVMFWGSEKNAAHPTTDVVGELERFLVSGGVGAGQCALWLDRLRRTPYNEQALIHGAGDVVAEVLQALAFESELDLERARSLFLAAWPVVHERALAKLSEPREEASEIEIAMAEFDRDRASGLDVESSFAELERKLGLDEPEDDSDGPAPDFPGVVGAVVEEFLWEQRALVGEEQACAHDGLRIFASYAKEIGVIDNLGPRTLLAFAAFWLPESRQLKSGAEAERMMRALVAFGRWAVETQGVDVLQDQVDECLKGLQASLPRAVVANSLLPRVRDVEGELFTYHGPNAEGLGLIRDEEGVERPVALDARLAALLEAGDLFRGFTDDDGHFVVACCYPPEAANLKQSKR